MSEPALSVAFFDPVHRLHGTARAGLTLLFDGTAPNALPEAAQIATDGDGYRAALDGRFDLHFSPRSEPADLGGTIARVCAVTGEANGQQIDCFGTATETTVAPAWAELDALRALSAIFDEGTAMLALARRPRGSLGHGEEDIRAYVLDEGVLRSVEDARISTVYDADGRQRDAGLELWLPEEDFPRRAAGVAAAGASLDLEGVRVHSAVFDWRMDGRRGVGAYEITSRIDPPEAA